MGTFRTDIQAVTNNRLLPKLQDSVLKSNLLTLRLLSNPKQWRGRNLEIAVKVSRSTTNGSFDGLDSMTTALSTNKQKLSFDPRHVYQTVSLAGTEVDIVKADPGAAIDLAAGEFESAKDDLADVIGDQLYGDGTGNSNKDFLGLKAIIDDGTYASSYGGLVRATYTTLKSSVYTPAGALTSLSTIGTAVSGARYGADKVTMIVTGDTKFNEVEAFIQATLRTDLSVGGQSGKLTRYGFVPAKDGMTGEVGFDSIFYRGIPITADQKCPALYMYGINENYLDWYAIPSTMDGYTNVKVAGDKEVIGNYSAETAKSAGFAFSGWEFTPNQYGAVGKIVVQGNLISGNPNRHFRIIFGA